MNSSSTRNVLKTWSPTLWNKRVAIFLTFFIAHELGTIAEARPAARKVTIINRAGRYLTIGKHRITGEYPYSPYGKKIHSLRKKLI